MQVYSFVRHLWSLVPIEVEVHLTPGLPQIQITGQPDAVIKESTVRVKSALKAQGFQFPRAQVILVNLRPHYLKKQSRGLDLAIAVAILLKTEQIAKPNWTVDQQIFVYGELSLTGHVQTPDDFSNLLKHKKDHPVLTGNCADVFHSHSLVSIEQLQDLKEELLVQTPHREKSFQRPEEFLDWEVSASLGELIKIIAHGEHHALLSGPAGSGKTTAAKIIHSLLQPPNPETFALSAVLARSRGQSLNWRPLVAPHHTITSIGLLGGGGSPQPGEISRAHGGVLLLDELLEFSRQAQEGLREPFEQGEITVARSGHCHIFPAKSLILATTNLCPCGRWVPNKVVNCHRSARRCMGYLEKLSGPLLDRFTILSFSHKWRRDKKIKIKDLLSSLNESRNFMKKRGKKLEESVVNEELPVEEIEKTITPFVLQNLMPEFSSLRRRKALLRVARTIADLQQKDKIDEKIIAQAQAYTTEPFFELERQRG